MLNNHTYCNWLVASDALIMPSILRTKKKRENPIFKLALKLEWCISGVAHINFFTTFD
jgi:hypothetical protein